jgi:hypothetical protein
VEKVHGGPQLFVHGRRMHQEAEGLSQLRRTAGEISFKAGNHRNRKILKTKRRYSRNFRVK